MHSTVMKLQRELVKANERVEELRNKLLTEFPLLDDEGLCQEEHHCEWTLQQDRKRLHAMLQSAPAKDSGVKSWLAQ